MEGQRYYVRARLAMVVAAVFGLIGVWLLASVADKPMGGHLAIDGQMLLFQAVAVFAMTANGHLWGWRQSAPLALMLVGSGLLGLEGLVWLATHSAALSVLNPAGLVVLGLGWLVLAVGIAVKPAPKA